MGRAPWMLALLVLSASALPLAEASLPVERRLVSFDLDAPLVGALVGGARVVEAFPFARVAVVEGTLPELRALAALPGVAGVYRDEPLTPNLDRVRALVRAEPEPGEAWPSGGNVTIALVDSGIDASHPGFAGRIAAAVRISRSGFVSEGGDDRGGHGTHVAGILAGDGARSDGGRLRGLAPASRLVAVDISDSFTTTSAVRAFEWIYENRAKHGIRVVSNSWGREKADARYDADDPVIRASDALVANGLVVVFSAGNRGRDGEATLTTEASNPNVLAVGAASAAGRAEPYSSRGPARDGAGVDLAWTKPDLVAPGTAVVSARASSQGLARAASDEERYYMMMNGTSMAAPQVAAAAALIIDRHPSLEPTIVAAILQRTARDVGAVGPDADTGFGMLDVRAALLAADALEAGERSIVVERRVPVRESGSLAAVQGLVLLDGAAPRLPPAQSVELPLALPAGASRVELWFNWSGQASFDARLEGPGASIPFERAGASSLRLARDVEPGAHRVVATPTSPASSTPYALEGDIVVLDARVVDQPAELHSRPPPASGGFFVPVSGTLLVADVVTGEPMMVLTALVVVSLAAAAWGARRRP